MNSSKGTVVKNWVKLERARIDITQRQLAEAIGVSVQTINIIEKNKVKPSYITAVKIANYFKLPISEIFILEEDINHNS